MEKLARPAGFEPTTPWFVVRSSERNRLIHLTNLCRASVAICSTVHNRAQLNPAKLRQPLAGSNVHCPVFNHLSKSEPTVLHEAGSTTHASTHVRTHTKHTANTPRHTPVNTQRNAVLAGAGASFGCQRTSVLRIRCASKEPDHEFRTDTCRR